MAYSLADMGTVKIPGHCGRPPPVVLVSFSSFQNPVTVARMYDTDDRWPFSVGRWIQGEILTTICKNEMEGKVDTFLIDHRGFICEMMNLVQVDKNSQF